MYSYHKQQTAVTFPHTMDPRFLNTKAASDPAGNRFPRSHLSATELEPLSQKGKSYCRSMKTQSDGESARLR
jgi:hypothetical protein